MDASMRPQQRFPIPAGSGWLVGGQAAGVRLVGRGCQLAFAPHTLCYRFKG